jgi:hypothetical protein
MSFEPKKSLHFQHLANFSEVLLYFSGSLAGCFLALLVHELVWLQIAIYLLMITYFIAIATPVKIFWLRLGAMVFALALGFKELIPLFMMQSVLVFVILAVVLFIVLLLQRRLINE